MDRESAKYRLPVLFVCLAAAVLGRPQSALAQTNTASLQGQVTDASGAVVPQAQVTLTNVLEKASRQTVTGSSGEYVIPAILPGQYQLVITKSGFETRTITGINLSSGQASTINIALQVGKAVTQVNVQAVAPLLQTGTATVGTTLTGTELTTLPLIGRNYTQALWLLPGLGPMNSNDSAVSFFNPGRTLVVTGVSNGVSWQPSIYGQRSRSSTTMVDGAITMYPEGGFSGINPPPEAIAEMKVDMNTDTGSGNTSFVSGATINVVTKSGTYKYHGSLWEMNLNNGFKARNFFEPTTGVFRWNQFGFAGGGPLAIPHLISKQKAWYIFGWYEGIRASNSTPGQALVPTVAERNGDFSADSPIYNPYTTVVNSNGQVTRQPFPGNQIPMGATTLCAPKPTCVDPAALTVMNLYPLPNAVGVVPGVNWISPIVNNETSDQWSVRVDHQFGAKDNFFMRYTDLRYPETGEQYPSITQTTYLRYTNIMGSETHTFNPTFLVTSRFSSYGANEHDEEVDTQGALVKSGLVQVFPVFHGTPYLPNIGIENMSGLTSGGGITGPQYYLMWSADAQKIQGHHTIGFGGDVLRMTGPADSTTRGERFDSVPTSNTGVSNITGVGFASFLLGLPSSANTVVGSERADVRSTSYGLYAQDSFRATRKLTVNFGARWDITPAPVNIDGSGTYDWEHGKYLWDKTNPITGQPPNVRRGLIPTYWGNVSPRIGIAYALTPKTVVRSGFGLYYDTQEFLYQRTQANRGNWPYSFPASVGPINVGLPEAYMENPFPSGFTSPTSPPTSCNQCIETDPNATKYGYSQEWNLSVQHQLTPSMRLEVDYLGSRSVHLEGQVIANAAMTPGLGPITDRQLDPTFRPFTDNGFNLWNATYNALVVQFTKRFSHNLSINANYTWAKTLDDYDSSLGGGTFGGATAFRVSYWERNSIWGPAAFGLSQRAMVAYTYDLPIHSTNKFLNAIVGNWQNTGILSLDSGFPYWITLSTDNENTGGGVEWPNLTCNPSANWTPTVLEYFNTSCYQIPAFGTRGNAGKHALYGDGMFDWDATLSKEWPFGENRNVAFRVDALNLPNSHTFASPNPRIGTPFFGVVNGTRQQGRIFQFTLKVNF